MGKWSTLKARYARLTEGDPKFTAKVAEVRGSYAASTFPELIANFTQARAEKERRENEIKDLNVDLEALSQLLLERFDEQDLTSVKTEAGQILSVSVEPYPSVTDRGALESYIAQNLDLDYLYSVHPSSLKAFVKELLETGRDSEIPPGVSIFLKSGITIKKS